MDEVMKVWIMMVNVIMVVLTTLLIITVLSVPVHGAQNRTEMVTTKVVAVFRTAGRELPEWEVIKLK